MPRKRGGGARRRPKQETRAPLEPEEIQAVAPNETRRADDQSGVSRTDVEVTEDVLLAQADADLGRGDPGDADIPADADVTDEEGVSLGEEIETRERSPMQEAQGADALDGHVLVDKPAVEDVPLDAVDEIAAVGRRDDYRTTDSGDRRPRVDNADMGLGAEPRSPEELEDAAIGKGLSPNRGVTRDGESHGSRFLDQP